MDTQNRRFRLTAAIATTAMLLGQAPPPSNAQESQGADPPSRVGRLAELSGTVSFHAPGDDQWRPATLNYPITQGDTLWTEPNAHAAIEVSASRIVMASGTELEVATLNDSAVQATEPQGELYLRVRAASQGETYAVQTPRGLASLAVPGRYDVMAGDIEHPTVVTVVEGSAHVAGAGVSLNVAPGQAATISGTDTFQGEVAAAQHDAFLTSVLDSERPPQAQGAAPPPAVAAMPGGEDLTQYGSWSDTEAYGPVWYPQVPPDWVPYRDGTWAYVAPWGWTWVDSEPWGFAPFHYGRWAMIDGHWAWVPGTPIGPVAPAYAPALVTFFGLGAIAGLGIGAVLSEGRIGWCPLGPREPFIPWYRASDRYMRGMNPGHFSDINRDVPLGNFVNHRAATVVPAGVLTGSRPVPMSLQPTDPAQFAQLRPLTGQHPLPPAPTTLGMTPAVAREFNLSPTGGFRAISPGPPIHPMPAGIAAGPIVGREGLPALRAPQPQPQPAVVHPFTAVPALRTPPAPGQIGPPTVDRPSGFAAQGAVPHPPTQFYRAPGAVFQQPVPPATLRPPTPAVVHPNPPPPPVRPPPPTPVHAQPSPEPRFHAPPPRPVEHTPPPAQNGQHRRPGEP